VLEGFDKQFIWQSAPQDLSQKVLLAQGDLGWTGFSGQGFGFNWEAAIITT
jgi:hypothetical protein